MGGSREYCVYIVANRFNGRFYVGSTDEPKRRWAEHRRGLNSVQFRLDSEHYGYSGDDLEFRIVRRFGDALSMLRFEQALIRLHWGTFLNYNTATETIPGAIRSLWMAVHFGAKQVRWYLSPQAACRDLYLRAYGYRGSLERLRSGPWVLQQVRDGVGWQDVQNVLPRSDSFGQIWLDADGRLCRRDPDGWGSDAPGVLLLPINEHQLYPRRVAWEFRLAQARARRASQKAATEEETVLLRGRARHYGQCAKACEAFEAERDFSVSPWDAPPAPSEYAMRCLKDSPMSVAERRGVNGR